MWSKIRVNLHKTKYKAKKWIEQDRFSRWILLYSALWIFIMLAMFWSFIKNGKSFVWKQDGMYSYLPSLAYGGHYIREVFKNILEFNFTLPLYDFNYGMGLDVTTLITGMFTDPFRLVAVILPMSKVELAYTISVLLRFYFAGLSFIYCCRYMKLKTWNAMIGVMVYLSANFALNACLKHPQFMTPMILLPLLIVGTDKIIVKKECKFFIIVLAMSMANSYYFTFMNTIVIFTYGVCRYFTFYQNIRIDEFVRMILCALRAYILGILLAAVSYIPQLVNFFQSVRTGEVIGTNSLLFYNLDYYKKFIMYFITPFKTSGYWALTGFSAIVILILVYLYMQRDREARLYQWIIGIMTVFLLSPIFAFIFSGFNSVSNRWCYAYGFFIALMVSVFVGKLERLKKKEIKAMFFVCIIYFVIALFIQGINRMYTLVGVTMLASCFLMILMINYEAPKNKRTFKRIIFGFVFFSTFLYSYYQYEVGGFSDAFVDRGSALKVLKDSPMKLVKELENHSFYRVEHSMQSNADGNRSLVLGMNGVAQYSSVNNAFFNEYHAKLDNRGVKDIVVVYNMDGRTALNTLASVKYYAIKKGQEAIVPYGYQLVTENKKYSVYENRNVLPIGYTYDSYMLEEEYDKLESLGRQESMLSSVILSDNVENLKQENVDTIDLEYSEAPVEVVVTKNVVIEENQLIVKKDKGSITVRIQGKDNAECYLAIHQLISENTQYDAKIQVTRKGIKKEKVILGKSKIYKPASDNYMFNMGQVENGTYEMKITFEKKGVFSYDSMKCYLQPMDQYAKKIEKLKKESLEEISLTANQVKGKITTTSNKVLCFSIPYSKGWTAYVNGEEVELIRANGMYMGIELQPGNYDIELHYSTPGLKLGGIISCFALLVFLYQCVPVRYKEKWKRK